MDIKQAVVAVKEMLDAERIREKILYDKGIPEVRGDKYLCWLHTEKTPSMSYNKYKKQFYCFGCGESYDIFDHYIEHYGITFIEALARIIKEFDLRVEWVYEQQGAVVKEPLKHLDIGSNGLAYMSSRGIELATCLYLGIKEHEGNIVFVYKDEKGLHIANKYRIAKVVDKGVCKTWFESGTNQDTLFNMDKININKPLVICEGEIDAISLIQSGYKNAVSIPTGAKGTKWIEKNWAWLQQFEEIIIWFDNDDTGKMSAREVANRLMNNTIKVVHQQDNKDINEMLCKDGAKQVIKVLKAAKEIDIEGILTMEKIEYFNVYEAEKIKSGIDVIDKYIKGYVMGSLVILTGYSGSGKSTLVNQMCIAEPLAQGYKTFAFSGELTPSNFRYWLYTTIAQEEHLKEYTTKEGYSYKKLIPYGETEITEWIRDKLYLYDKGDYTADAILQVMERLARQKGVKCFVLDNLMKIELNNGYKNELLAQKEFVNRLKNFARKYEAVVFLIAHPRKPPQEIQRLTKFDIAGTADITNLADYVMGIHRTSKKEREEYQVKLDIYNHKGGPVPINPRDGAIMLFKDRPTGTSDIEAALHFDTDRLRYYSTQKGLIKSYGYSTRYEQGKI